MTRAEAAIVVRPLRLAHQHTAWSFHRHHHLALGAALLDVLQRLSCRFEGEGAVNHRFDDAGLNERGDVLQLRAIGPHEDECVADVPLARLAPDTETQQAHDLLQRPGRPLLPGELRSGWPGDGN